MSTTSGQTPVPATASLSLWRIGAIAFSASTCLALLTASQTHLTMPSHGHSFTRLLLWQLGCWGFWALAAPWIVRLGGHARTRRLVVLGTVLSAAHIFVVAQLALWTQPFIPKVAYDLRLALEHLWYFFAMVDPLLIGLLIVCGRILASYERTRELELRESHLESQLTRAQLDALRLEIQPHFLFNTLNSLAALIRSHDNKGALSMLLCLSDLMRDTLDRADGQLAPLGRELELIRKYVELQRARFGERLQVEFQIERASERCDIPVLLLQPLVENALRHGLGPRPSPGRLVVGARLETSEALRMWVTDNGVGVPAGFDLSKDAGTGLGNTRARLGHLYGSRAELSVRSASGGGTVVEIVIPAAGARSVLVAQSGAA